MVVLAIRQPDLVSTGVFEGLAEQLEGLLIPADTVPGDMLEHMVCPAMQDKASEIFYPEHCQAVLLEHS